MKLPIPKTIRLAKSLPKLREYCVNLFYSEGNLISRPGVDKVADVVGVCRGIFTYSDVLYVLYGDSLYSYNASGFNYIGSIPGNYDIRVAKGFNHAAICSPWSGNYTLNTSGTLREIEDLDLPYCVDVEWLGGYFAWVPADGDPVIYSAVGDAGDIDSLAYFDAEELPDKNIGVLNFRSDLFVMGEDLIERFRLVGDESVPFVRVQGGGVPTGYYSGKIIGDDGFYFLGRNKGQGPGFFLMQTGGTTGRISTTAIDEILEQDYHEYELTKCRAQRFQWRGNDVFVFSLPRHSFCYVAGNWSFFSSEIDDRNVTPWDYTLSTYFNGHYYTGKTNVFGQLSTSNNDAGDKFQRIINTFARHSENAKLKIASIKLGAGQGLSDGGSIGLAMSNDGKLFGDRFFREMGSKGDFKRELVWSYPGGLGIYDGYAGIEFYTTSDISIAVDNAQIGL
jgi:hypothetical protein